MPDTYTKSRNYERNTESTLGISDGLAYFQDDYFQDDYFQGELLYASANADKTTRILTKERVTVMLNV